MWPGFREGRGQTTSGRSDRGVGSITPVIVACCDVEETGFALLLLLPLELGVLSLFCKNTWKKSDGVTR
jgi:hypothetical protein